MSHAEQNSIPLDNGHNNQKHHESTYPPHSGNITCLGIQYITFFTRLILNNRTIIKTGEDYTTTDGGTTFKVLGNEVVVKYAAGTSNIEKISLENTLGLTKLREASTGFIDYRLSEGSDYFSILQALESSSLVETAEVAMEGLYVLDPNDPLFPQQWYLHQANDADIDAPEAFDITMGSNRVVVAILDSGTDWTHEDIGLGPDAYQNVFLNAGEDAWADPNDPATGNGIDDDGNGLVDDWKGWDFVNGNNDSRGPNGHGTHVAGIVSAKSNNNLGMASVAGGNNSPGAQLLLVGVGDNFPVGNILDDAILYAANTGASIVQLSLTVGQTADIDAAIAAANAQGVLIVCAAGNSNGPVGYPARNPAVVAVGGTNQSDGKASFASFGADLDISAPAVDILSTRPGDAYNTGSGTSFAAPQVSAAAALLLSRNPCLSNDQIKQIFQFSADKVGGFNYNWNANMPGHSLELGYGRLNIRAALSDQTVLDVHINQNTTFNTDMVISGNIYVHTGTQLTITSTIQFGKDKGIIVERGAKLHVNGGTLTKCPDGEDWRGINVEGNASINQPNAFSIPAAQEAGVVLINNLAHVEWARTAISATRYNQGWNSAYWGGMVHCENATFLSNRRVAEFMKYDKPNQSKFINCTMESGGIGYTGVTIWDTDNVTFENCRFYNMTSQGILTYDAGAIVRDGSSFQHNERGIEGKATYPYVGKLMIGEMGSTPNYFLDNNRDDIRVESTAFGAGLEVVNNEFFGTSTAVRLIGPSRYTIRANSISGSGILGIAAIQTGAMGWNQPNRVDYNGIQKLVGMIANGPNREMQFICNNFSTSLWDFRLFGSTSSGTGEIRANQGGPWSPAGNCFTDPGTEIDILTQGPTSFFTYHALNTQCQRPLNPGNYGVSLTEIANGCEVPPVVGEEPPSEDEYYLLKQQISGGGSSEQLTEWTERKDIVLNGLVADYVSYDDIASALSLLDFEGTTTAKVMKYGVLVGSGDYQAATTELNALPSTDAELTTFKQVQHINLARMQQGLAYELSETDSAFLESVATGDLGVRSYARALMGLLKGRSYEDDDELDYVPGGGESFGINTGAGKTAVEKVSVFPNPTAGLFTVRLPEGLSAARLQVTAATGQVLLDQPILGGQYRIDLDGKPWGKGIYLLVLRDAGGKSVHAQTIIVTQ